MALLRTFAAQTELVLRYHRAQAVLRATQISQDRDRIARDLHDHVIQQLFAAGMQLQATTQRSTDPTVAGRITDTVGLLDNTIRRIRTTVFELRDTSNENTGSVRADILAVVADAARGLGFDPSVQFSGPLDTLVTPALHDHLLAALREMLLDLARHAAAGGANITITATDTVCVEVSDDGVGLPPGHQVGSGLRNLTDRAASLGGSFTLNPVPGGGTHATWTAPTYP